ncbi:MAG TPA: DUF3667 domain-containing protein [Gammaproteobacteria bacterium]|nr:DUF3667 domain-containing protein [Gammaproteobacteria bacterium]
MRTLGDFLGDAVDTLTNVNGKLLKSLRLLLFRPGFLSAEHARGARVPYVRPVQLFVVANLAFFLWSYVPIFSTPLQVHTWSQGFPHRAVAERWVREAVAPDMTADEFRAVLLQAWSPFTTSTPAVDVPPATLAAMEALAQQFNARVELQGRALVVLMIPLFAIWPGMLNLRRRRHAIEHLVFATHFMSLVLLAALAQMWLMRSIHAALQSLAGVDVALLQSDPFNSMVLGLLMAAWLAAAVRVYYRRSWPAAVLQCLALVVLFLLSTQVFRAVLFFTTWWSL